MSKINDGGPAFPNSWDETNAHGVTFPYVERGMSKREHYAALAMQGLCANPALAHMDAADITRLAAQHADALIVTLEEEGRS